MDYSWPKFKGHQTPMNLALFPSDSEMCVPGIGLSWCFDKWEYEYEMSDLK